MKKYLQQYGQNLLDNGYAFIPISPLDAKIRDKKTNELVPFKSAGKAPLMSGWQSVTVDEEALDVWKKKYFRHGIGIRTWFTPAVDIDCMDEDAAHYMRDFIEGMVGFAPARVGRAPKTLLVYRTDEPFTKVKSHTWVDDWGQKNAVEILGAGQQFVAFGIHPGTKKPYHWTSIDTPLNCQADMDLENITLAMARQIVDEFDRYALDQGWQKTLPGDDLYEPAQRGKNVSGRPEDDAADGEVDEDDWVDADDAKEKWEGSYEDFESLMEDMPPAEDYASWFKVLAAIKDAEREPDEFRDIARDWSAKASNFDADGFDDKWDNGNFRRTGGASFTLRNLEKAVEDARMEKDILLRIKPLFESADNLHEWDRAAERLRETPVWGTIRDYAVELACDQYKRITGKKIPVTTKKLALAVDHTQFDAPEWLEPWIFVSSTGEFVHKKWLHTIKPASFDIMYAAKTFHLGVKPVMFASAMRPVPVVSGTMYYPIMHGDMAGNKWKPAPGLEGKEYFSFDGRTFLNSFNPASIPELPEKITKSGRKAAETVLNYFRVQFPDDNEFHRAMDWIAWVINNPALRMSYSLLILGGQGSGKSIVKKFLKAMLGAKNVGTVNNQVIQKSFTGWQAGSIVKVIEEISVSGHRYDVVNALKEPISNEELFIERKGADGIEEVNTASWMMYTNDIAALPITDNDRRFLIVRSRFRNKEEVMEFTRENPKFFKTFEIAFTKYAPEIRLWFKDWEYQPDFNREGHAPETESTKDMIDTSQDDFTVLVREAIESGDMQGVTEELIHTGYLLQNIPRDMRPSRSRIASKLAELGYHKGSSSRVQIRVNGLRGSVWMKNPEKWRVGKNDFDYEAMKEHLENQISANAAKEVAEDWL